MSKPSPFAGLAGSIAATDWPDPAPARAALDAMMSLPSELESVRVEDGRLERIAESLKKARQRRMAEEEHERKKREAAQHAAIARRIRASREALANQQSEPARNEPEMEF